MQSIKRSFHAETFLNGPARVGFLCLFGGALALLSQGASLSPQDEEARLALVTPAGVPVWSLASGEAPQGAVRAPRRLFRLGVTATGYSSTEDQTDSTPFVTASNTRVRPGVLAVSRDLLREFTPGAPFGYGDQVELEGVGVFTVEDTMNPRFAKRVDIWFSSREAARRWGRRQVVLSRLSSDALAQGRFDRPSSIPLFEAALAD